MKKVYVCRDSNKEIDSIWVFSKNAQTRMNSKKLFEIEEHFISDSVEIQNNSKLETLNIKSKWIHFTMVKQLPKTYVFNVIANENSVILGQVKWHSPWRKYSFFPNTNTLYEKQCLRDIANFCEQLMEDRKINKE